MRNKRKNIAIIILLFGIGLIGVYTTFLYQENQELHSYNQNNSNQIDSLNNYYIERINKLIILNKKTQSKLDSLQGVPFKTIEKYDISIGNKKISLDELVKIANRYSEMNSKLRYEHKVDSAKLDYYKDLIKQLKNADVIQNTKSGNISYRNINQLDTLYSNAISKLNRVEKNLTARKMALALIKKNYGLDVIIKNKNDSISVKLTNYKKLDSALFLFPYYKHKIKTNRKGETIVK